MVNIAATGFGILLASRQPRNPIGWLFLAAGFALGVSGFGTSYGLHALVVDPGSLPAGRAAAWISNWTGLIPLGVLCFLFLLFPTGHLRSARWRPAAWFVAGAFTLVTAFFLVFSTMSWNDPYGGPSSGGSSGFSWWVLLPLLIVSSLVVSLAAVVVRFRGSSGEERLQLKWFATGAAFVVAALIPTFGSNAPVFLVLQSLAFVVLFTAVAVAVLKYRLYDIDVVISKTVVYATLAAFFTAVYVAVVVGLGTAIGSTHDPFLTVAAAAVIAVAFNPVRERARRLADRLVYGTRATPYEVLSEFSEHMAGTYALDDILPRMARVLAEGTGGRAEIWLRVGDRLRAVSTWPSESASDGPSADRAVVDEDLPEFPGTSKATPVLHRGTLLGAITVTKPPNDPLRPDEGKLIDDVASQAGLVLFNVRLIEELRASRQRLVKAQDEERRRLERNIHDGAQQQLVALAVKANLAQTLAKRDPDKVEVMLGQLKDEATDALENLRDLARGDLPAAARRQGTGGSPGVPGQEVVGARVAGVRRPRALPAGGRGRGLLLLPRGAAEHLEVRGGEHGDDPPGRRVRHARVRGDRRRPWVRSRFDRLRHRAPGDGRPTRRLGRVAGGAKHAGAGNDRRGTGTPVVGKDPEPEIVAPSRAAPPPMRETPHHAAALDLRLRRRRSRIPGARDRASPAVSRRSGAESPFLPPR